MQTFKLLFCRALNGPLRREIHTNVGLLARSRKISSNFGLNRPVENHNYNDDPRSLENTGEEEPEDFDLMQVDRAYDEHLSEVKLEKKRLKRAIIKKNFFAPRAQPAMLTYNERQCIKYLHQENPTEWDVKALSESFPATPRAIKQILKNKWKFSPERVKKWDERVLRNWQLLAEDKLDADPEVLEHLKKFTNRSPVLLEQIKNAGLYLPEIKEKKVWNNGEMNSILKNYEKSIKNLEKKHLKKTKEIREIESGTNGCITNTQEHTNRLNILQKQVSGHTLNKESEKKESHIVGEVVKGFKEHMTFEKLQGDFLKEAETNKNLSLSEKGIMESTLGIVSHEDDKQNSRHQESLKQTESQSLLERKKINKKKVEKFEKNPMIKSKKFEGEEKTKEIKYDSDFSEKRNKLRRNFSFSKMEENQIINKENCFASEVNIGEKLNLEDVHSPKIVVIESEREVKTMEMVPEREKKDELYYEKEVDEIKCTSFWNSGRSSAEKATAELNKALLAQPKVPDTSITPEVYRSEYPERIKIPKSKRGSGLTFKVNDCYYDDDGQFLYRVPGMTG